MLIKPEDTESWGVVYVGQIFGENKKDILDKTDIHIHFPAGAVGKDGPSAGVTIITVLVSLFSDRCVRSDTAMTGEITLRGLVLPVVITNYSEQQINLLSTSRFLVLYLFENNDVFLSKLNSFGNQC